MILTETHLLSNNSHKKVNVKCDFNISENCKKEWVIEYRLALKTLKLNDGKIICLPCSRRLKASGRDNPNCKYKDIDDNFFEFIDSPEKALLLGWIASDGSLNDNTIRIGLEIKDIKELTFIKNIISENIPITYSTNYCDSHEAEFVISSRKMMSDCCKHLKITPGPKHKTVRLPDISDEYKWYFLCGYFNGDGTINKVGNSKNYPVCSIASNSIDMLEDIAKFVGGKSYICSRGKPSQSISIEKTNCLDFIGKIYSKKEFALERKYKRFLEWCQWVPSLQEPGSGNETVKFTRTRKDAIKPFKKNISDSGYDLTILDIVKQVGDVTFYSTGIKITPTYGYYFQLVPRSSISKSGYMLANSIGIIDRSFVGEIIIPLIKIDKNMPDLQLPCRIAQIIPTEIKHFELEEIDELIETSRGSDGFGSSGRF